MGSKTLEAIAKFQKSVLNMEKPDQLVQPGGPTFRKLNESASAAAKAVEKHEESKEDSNADAGGGKVSGQTNGVGQDILDFLEAVANYYGKEIKILSGLRDKKKQADVMYRYWTKTLNRGQIYTVLKSNSKLRKQLDDLWTKGQDGDSDAEQSFKSEIEKIAGSLSLHLTGRAVDVPTNLDKKVVTVLKSQMHFIDEKNREGQTTCYHFDSKANLPAVSDSMKSKWPKK
jgi:hypothetical protein